MNFNFSENQYAFRDSVRELLKNRHDVSRLRASLDAEGLDQGLWQALTDLGLQMILVPEEQGGLGLSLLDAALLFEEFGRALLPGPMTETLIATDLLTRHGGTEHAPLLANIATGDARWSIALQERDHGFGSDGVTTRAISSGNGWRLRGAKALVANADEVDQILVTARLDNGDLAVFAVAASAVGVSNRRNIVIDPSYRYFDVRMDDVPIAANARIGGAAAAERLFSVAAAAASLHLVGCSETAFTMALEYAKQREQFGRPIGAFQAIKHKLADMYMWLESARSAAYYAAWAVSEEAPGWPAAVSVAKAASGDASRMVCNESHQIHGGLGFTWEYDLHFFIKRAKLLEYSFGDAAWHEERVVVAAIAEAKLDPTPIGKEEALA